MHPLFEKVTLGVTKLAINDNTNLSTFFTPAFNLRIVYISRFKNVVPIGPFIPVEAATGRDDTFQFFLVSFIRHNILSNTYETYVYYKRILIVFVCFLRKI